MGRVFSFNQITTRQIPKQDDFDIMHRFIRREFESCDEIIAGLMYGSVLTGKHTRRSDIDFLYIYRNNTRDSTEAILYKIQREAKKRHITLQFAPFEERIARTPFHYIDLQFSSNLLMVGCKNGGVIKRNPFDIFHFDTEDRLVSVRQHLRDKIRRLEKRITEMCFLSEDRFYDFLGKSLQGVLHICRVMLYLYGKEAQTDTRVEIVQKYEAVLKIDSQYSDTLKKKLHALLQLDAYYTTELEAQCKKPDQKRYDQLIKEIKLAMPLVLNFIKANSLFIEKNYKSSPI